MNWNRTNQGKIARIKEKKYCKKKKEEQIQYTVVHHFIHLIIHT